MIKEKVHTDVIHSDRSQLQRDNTVRAFRAGQIWVLICTELMGRGIDFNGVNLVINYDFPPATVSYIHRIGEQEELVDKVKPLHFLPMKIKHS